MRAFIAIDIPEDLKKDISDVQHSISSAGGLVLKMVALDNIHLTLKFLGEIDDNTASAVKDILGKVASVSDEFESSLSGFSAFPRLDRPNVFWIGVGKNKALIQKIAREIGNECMKIGLPGEDRDFVPHATIGRVSFIKQKDFDKELLRKISFPGKPFAINELVLYKSTLTPKGPVYQQIHVSRLSKDS